MEMSYQNLFCFYRFASQTQIFCTKTVLFQAIGTLLNIRWTGLRNEHETTPVNQDGTHTLSYVQGTWVQYRVGGTGFIDSIYIQA